MKRNPKRIKKILSLLTSIWDYCPDLRLGQIIVNATNNVRLDDEVGKELFFIEDDEMIKQLETLQAMIQQREQPRT